MKLPFIITLIVIAFNLKAQYVLDAHKVEYEYYLTVKIDPPNTLLWFYTPIDSVLLDNKTLVYRSYPSSEYSAFFVILNSEGKIQRYNEIYTKDTTKNSAVLAYMDISEFNENYYVSFYYYGNDLWLNDKLVFQDESSGGYTCLVKLSKYGEVISWWRYPVSRRLREVWIKPLQDGKIVMGGTTSTSTIQLGSFTLPCLGCHTHDSDVFVAIIDSLGEVLNAKRFGTDYWDYCHAITTHKNDIYMTGSYYGSPFQVDSFTLTNHGFTQLTCDAFLIKLNENLETQWLQRTWGSFSENGQGLEQDSQGNLYWAVDYNSAQTNIGDTTLTGYKANGFLAKTGPDGELLWIQNMASDGALNIRKISADAGGNTWMNVNFTVNLLTSYQAIKGPGGNDNLLVQFGSDGQPYRQLMLSSPEHESVYEIQALPNQQLLLHGAFTGDTLSFLNLRLPRDQEEDAFTDFFATVQFPAVGTTESISVAGALRVFPNPVRSNQPVRIEPDGTWEKGLISVFNSLGQIIAQFETDPASQGIFIPGGYLQPGIYFLRYQSAKAEMSKVLVVTY